MQVVPFVFLQITFYCTAVSGFHFLNEFQARNFDWVKKTPAPKAIPSIVVDSAKIDSAVNTVLTCASIPAMTLAIVQTNSQGQVIQQYTKGYGVLDPTSPSGPKTNADSRFCIGSVTKHFTAALVGQILYQNGQKTLWDTPLEQLLGPVQSSFYGQPTLNNQLFTLRDILSHRTAIPRYDGAWSINPKIDRSTLWQNIHHLKPIAPISGRWRSSFEYNNWMYALAGYIAEYWDNRGLKWEDLIHQHYFQPLGMTSSTFLHTETSFSNWALPGINNALYNSSQSAWSTQNKAIYQLVGGVAPAGSICSTANDMAKYLAYLTQANNTSPLLPQKWIVRQAQSPSNLFYGLLFSGQPSIPVDISTNSYGFGWAQGVYRAYQTVAHSGGIFGYLSHLTQYPDLNLAIFMSSTNDVNFGSDKTAALSLAIFDIIMQKQTWLTPPILCSLPPLPQVNTTGFVESCTFPVSSTYLTLAGLYKHPLFGLVNVSNQLLPSNQMKVRFQWGTAAHGYLCTSTYDGPNTYRMKADASSPYAFALNYPQFSLMIHANVTFNLGQNGLPVSLVNWMIEPRAKPSAITFYVNSYVACQTNNPCKNGGTCIPRGQFDYMCQCKMWFTGANCQYGPNRDCSDLHQYYGKNTSGLYWIHPTNGPPIKVYCDMVTSNGGWTLIQRRVDGSMSFAQSWAVYQRSFGFPTANYWMGLNNISMLTSMQNTNYTIRVDLWDCNNLHAYEEYDNFWISGSSDKYRFHVTGSSARGTANDAFTFGFSYFTQQNMQFSTPDQDNDNSPNENCAQQYSSGWWFNACYAANLNGVYHPSCTYSGVRNGIEWIPWKFSAYSMKKVEIKIKRMCQCHLCC